MAWSNSLPLSLPLLLRLFVVSVLVNAPWEIGQAFLYQGMDYSLGMVWHCTVAALGDGVLVLIMHGLGWAALGRSDWFTRPGWRRYALMLCTGLLIGIAVEWVAVHWLGRWSYTALMPLVPGLGIGVVPVLQMLLLPPVVFSIVSNRWRAVVNA